MPADARANQPTISPSVAIAIKTAEPAAVLAAKCTAVEESYVSALWTSVSVADLQADDATNTMPYMSAVCGSFDTAVYATICDPELSSIWAAFGAAE